LASLGFLNRRRPFKIMPKTTPAPAENAGFGAFLYNPERGEVMGRTASSWAKIGLFYVIYYTGLACFFIALLSIFLHTFTDDKAPILTGKYSILPPLPGMGYQPMVKAEETLITYNASNVTTADPYIKAMETYLTSGVKADRVKTLMKPVNYMKPNPNLCEANITKCKTPDGPMTRETKPCMFDASSIVGLSQACPEEDYGYKKIQPCVAVKLNRIYEFVPQLNDTNAEDILIKCEGEHIADRDNVGTIKYFPANAAGDAGVIKTYYFPYLGQPYYMTPMVFVKFETIKTNILVQVVCKPINLVGFDTEGRDGHGKIHFEVYITGQRS